MSEPVLWIGVGSPDYIPTASELESVRDSVGDAIDGKVIVTAREVKPMNQEEREEYVRELIAALED